LVGAWEMDVDVDVDVDVIKIFSFRKAFTGLQ
jgi:hypothetical protein